MKTTRRPLLGLGLALALGACHEPGAPRMDLGVEDLAVSSEPDLSTGGDLVGVDGAVHADADFDASPSACLAPSSVGRGLAWTRAHGMMISGLNVSMGAPSTAVVNDYFDAFHANTVHLWATGLPTEVAGWAAAAHAGFQYVSWVQADGTSAANAMQLGGAAALPGRIGYQIGDEPQDMPTLTTMLASASAIRAADPDALTIINVNDNATSNAIATTAIGNADVDVLSYDHYTYGRSGYNGLGLLRAAATAAGKPYWRYTRAYYPVGGSPESTDADLRWDAYVGVAYGFSGLTWFIYQIQAGNVDLQPLLFAVQGDASSTKTAFFATVATLNTELGNLAGTLGLLHSTDVRYVAAIPILLPGGTTAWAAGAGGDPYLSSVAPPSGIVRDAVLGFFRDDCDEPYVVLQNAGHPGAEFPNNSSASVAFHVAFDFSHATDPTLDRSALASIDPSTGALTTIALGGTGDLRSVDLPIAAGGAVIWKYKNARPIVGR